MPKPKKLHTQSKPLTIQKNISSETENGEIDPEENTRKFELELCWCIQKLEKTLADKKLPEKQLQESWKVMTVLKNNTQPAVRKRQLMRTYFGDYRVKMADEEKQLVNLTKGIQIIETPPDKAKATFIRKSAFLSTGNESFRFNFTPPDHSEDLVSSTNDPQSNEPDSNSLENMAEVKKKDCNDCRFKFSNSEFKFNFNITNEES